MGEEGKKFRDPCSVGDLAWEMAVEESGAFL
jgi:hypothetical protein